MFCMKNLAIKGLMKFWGFHMRVISQQVYKEFENCTCQWINSAAPGRFEKKNSEIFMLISVIHGWGT